MIPTKFSWNLIISFEEEDQNKHFPGSPLPQHITPNRAPMGPPTKNAMNNFHSSSREVSTHYMYVYTRSVLLLDLAKKMFEIYIVFILHVPFLQLWISYTLKDDSYQVWMKSDHFTPIGPPMGPPTEMPWTTFIVHLERYLHTIYQVCPTSRSGEEDVWNLHSFYPWGPSPWAPLRATCTILATLDLLYP